ncbi:MAG: transposase [candidate division WOR-3 bacterium]|nr:MAG: transposase [candidate division WOR-3 bacterium]
MCRGNERRKIFLDDDDRYRFVKLLAESVAIYNVKLYAYVLMNNHFHLVVQTVRANLSEFMRRFNISYTAWFNFHHRTCGHLYQGRYKSLLVDADNYLLELSRYVHLNPVRSEKMSKCEHIERWRYLKMYPWSSFVGYLSAKLSVKFVAYDLIINMVGNRRAYQRFLFDGIRDGVKDIFEDVRFQTILGGDAFVTMVTNEYLERGSLREQPMYRDMVVRAIAPSEVIACCAEVLSVEISKIKARSSCGVIRGIVADMLYRYSGINQREIGELLGGIEYTAVNMLRCRLQQKRHDPVIQSQYARVERKIRRLCEL